MFEDLFTTEDEIRVPELIQCEVPKSPSSSFADFLDEWLQQSSVGQNVKTLHNDTTFIPRGVTSPAKKNGEVKIEANGTDVAGESASESKSKSRVRKAASGAGGEKKAKKPTKASTSQSDAPTASKNGEDSNSSNSDSNDGIECNLSQEQISAILQKVVALELQQSGFDSISSRALEVFAEIVLRYILKLSRALRVMLDRYGSLSVDAKVLWNSWLRAMHVSMTELPLFAHHDVISTKQRLAAAQVESDTVPHMHSALATLVQDNKQILDAFQQDQPVRLSRKKSQASSPPRDYSAYFDPSSVDPTAAPNFQYSLDSFSQHTATQLAQNGLDPSDPSYAAYPTTYPYFDAEKNSFYGYVPPNLAAETPQMASFPTRRN